MPLKNIDGHSELLEQALRNLVENGVLVIRDIHLRHWTKSDRMRSGKWQYVSDLINEVLMAEGEDEHGYKVYVGEGADQWSFLLWDRGEGGDLPDNRWWKPISELALEKKKRVRITVPD